MTTVASVDTNPPIDLSSTIRQIVREELLRHEEQARYVDPRYSSCAFRDAMCSTPSTHWQHSVNAADFGSYRDGPHHDLNQPSYNDYFDQSLDQRPRNGRSRRAATAYDSQRQYIGYSQRTATAEQCHQHPDVRPMPVCYSCGTPGHIARYCTQRRPSGYGQSMPSAWQSGRIMDNQRPGNCSLGSHSREERPRTYTLGSYFKEGRPRNRSPASDRTLTPPPAFRAYRSPSPRRRIPSSSPRRRFPSPPPEN